jgi:cysteinyl-tRNA synthetase
MDFSWEALEGAHERLSNLRQRVADWARQRKGAGTPPLHLERILTERVTDLDRRFRDAVGEDLDFPQALVVLSEAVGANDLGAGEKFRLLTEWDRVLGLDLERIIREHWVPTPEMRDLVRQRDEARGAKDFAAADEIRDRLASMGLEVMDTPEGTRIRPKP